MKQHPREVSFRGASYRWIRGEADRFTAEPQDTAGIQRRAANGDAARSLVEQLRTTSGIASFQEGLSELASSADPALGFSGPSGSMLLRHVLELSADRARAAEVLASALTTPANDGEAAEKIDQLVGYFGEIRKGSQPQASRAAPFVSAFWSLSEPERWPARSPQLATAFERLGWTLVAEHGAAYVEFANVLRALGPLEEVERVLTWFAETPWPGADPTIEQRIRWAQELKDAGQDDERFAIANIEAVLGPLRQAGDALNDLVGRALDRQVTKRVSPKHRTQDPPRARYDAYVSWVPKGLDPGWTSPPAFRLWFGYQGVTVGLNPGFRGAGWTKHAKEHLVPPEGLDLLTRYSLNPEEDQRDETNEIVVGRLIPYEELDWAAVPSLVEEVAARSLTVLQTLLTDGPNWDSTEVSPVRRDDPELQALFREFRSETGYPTDADVGERASREEWAQLLSEDSIAGLSVAQLGAILRTSRWGQTQSHAAADLLAEPDEDVAQQRMSEALAEFLYGEGTFGTRLDRAMADLPRLGQAGASKLLSIVHPSEFLPIHPLTGQKGKLALLRVLGVRTKLEGTLGERSTEANRLLRERLSAVPELKDDPWGARSFAHWLADRETVAVLDPIDARLALATERCTLPPESTFLNELVALLEEKGQIVLYGPPGTGKTFLALELAEALAPDDDRRGLVQFHPSMAYEDFIEGFRPVLRDGQLTYELSRGPLVELAQHAAEDPRPHVLVIDEMNRANLPKVFGELLFLLEYRDRPVRLAYRSDGDSFSLPKNLWIIGTMNLADRSVGQIDAALRRRFAFVPFTPSDEQNGGLLRRWLAKQDQPTWPADVVDAVNDELEADLGHSDLLLGPSYFMKPDLDEAQLALIWRYSIEPLTSDLFHGADDLVKKYGWEAVSARHSNLMLNAPGDDALH